jgi:hypothetical protein
VIDLGGAAVPSVFARYRAGLDRLRQSAGPGTENFADIQLLCGDLVGQLDAAEAAGDSDKRRRERNKVIYDLDQLTLNAFEQSYRELCQLGFSYDDWQAAPSSLAAALRYAEFSSITGNHTRSFVGREKLMRRIYETVNNEFDSSGYTIITGMPGIGKSAVMARLVQGERWAHHYVGEYLRSGKLILESICAQLIRAYDLPYDKPLYTDRDPCRALNELLASAARDRASWPVVIVIDGFDESDDLTHGSLNLPQNLPPGAFIIITRQPPKHTGHFFAQSVRKVDIVNDAQNKDDLREWMGRFIRAAGQEMRDAIAAFGRSETEFTEELVERSDGNFMYVTAILPDIRDGQITPAKLEGGQLPERLAGYYGYHWDRMRKLAGDSFDLKFVPVTSLLAGRVARSGPVTVSWLAKHSGLSRHEVTDVLDTWSRFFVRQGELIRFYHSSFRDFLADTVPPEDFANRADAAGGS